MSQVETLGKSPVRQLDIVSHHLYETAVKKHLLFESLLFKRIIGALCTGRRQLNKRNAAHDGTRVFMRTDKTFDVDIVPSRALFGAP